MRRLTEPERESLREIAVAVISGTILCVLVLCVFLLAECL